MIEVYDLRRLSEQGETLDEVLEKSWLVEQLGQDPDIALTPLADGRATLKLLPIGGDSPRGPVVRIDGTLTANLSTPCVRCLSDLILDLRSALDVTLFPAPPVEEGDARDRDAGAKGAPAGRAKKRKAREEEEEADALDPTEPDDATYTHHQIDLPTIVREALLLEIPMNPACADEAACAGRTSLLIASVTPSDEGAVDPRWAALEALKAKLT